MGIKIEVCWIMCEVGLLIVLGMEDLMKGIVEVKKVVVEVGYFIMLKVLVGGGGKGMCLVCSEEEMEMVLCFLQFEVGMLFGNDVVYIEKYIENFYYIEVQILGDKYGNVIYFYEWECFIQ